MSRAEKAKEFLKQRYEYIQTNPYNPLKAIRFIALKSHSPQNFSFSTAALLESDKAMFSESSATNYSPKPSDVEILYTGVKLEPGVISDALKWFLHSSDMAIEASPGQTYAGSEDEAISEPQQIQESSKPRRKIFKNRKDSIKAETEKVSIFRYKSKREAGKSKPEVVDLGNHKNIEPLNDEGLDVKSIETDKSEGSKRAGPVINKEPSNSSPQNISNSDLLAVPVQQLKTDRKKSLELNTRKTSIIFNHKLTNLIRPKNKPTSDDEGSRKIISLSDINILHDSPRRMSDDPFILPVKPNTAKFEIDTSVDNASSINKSDVINSKVLSLINPLNSLAQVLDECLENLVAEKHLILDKFDNLNTLIYNIKEECFEGSLDSSQIDDTFDSKLDFYSSLLDKSESHLEGMIQVIDNLNSEMNDHGSKEVKLVEDWILKKQDLQGGLKKISIEFFYWGVETLLIIAGFFLRFGYSIARFFIGVYWYIIHQNRR